MDEGSRLVSQARLAKSRARATYSKYPVGAAVLTASGNIYLGCNIESSAYPTTICAERVAIYSAIANGESEIIALAVITEDGGMPCGACRQVIHDQCGDISIYVGNHKHPNPEVYTTSQLYPFPFGESR